MTQQSPCIIDGLTVSLPDTHVLQETSDLFKVLGDETRLGILTALFSGSFCVHQLASLVNMSQSAVSHQLRILRQARMVSYRKEGRHTWYSLADDHVRQLVNTALDHVLEQS
ncbi:MAG TPA: metalloregulator ArsR/SmtB family transcription factor [Clostridia bacterium]|nr:metalloregulator ArsR/SmtB family transcription factor [Clostridia bacterium]